MTDEDRAARDSVQARLSSTTAAWRTQYWSVPTAELTTAGYDGELVVARGRLGLILAVMLVPIVALVQGPRREHWVAFGVAWFALILAIVSYLAARRHLWSRWLSFGTSLADVTMISLAHAAYILQGMPSVAANSRTNFTLYALAIAATTLRFDVRICLVSGALAVAQYGAIAVWAYASWLPNPTPDTVMYGEIEPGVQVGRLIVLVAMTWLSVAVVRQSARLRFASTHDPLTSLLNRRYFDERFAEEIERSRRSGNPLAVAILDVDRFKRINDEWGHPTGDAALRTVSRVIRQTVRRSDVVARYGGEEFVMMLEGSRPADALARLEKVRARIAAEEIPVSNGDPPLRITLSAGLALYPADGTEADELVRIADQRLLEAKRAGRDRVVSPL
ncbi:MAG: diguanylate cyclase [Gemmatimonadales bacterium]